jgi:hypothetical protein
LITGEKCAYLVLQNNHQNDQDKDDNNNNNRYDRGKTSNKKKSEDESIVEFVKRDMSDNQIDVSRYTAEGSLHIGTIHKEIYSYEKMRATKNRHELFGSLLPNLFHDDGGPSSYSSPTQFRLVLDVRTELHPMHYELAYLMKLEELFHAIFHSLGGSSICSYFVRNVEQAFTDYSEYGKLLTVRLNSHSGVIFARRFGKGLALALE